MSLSTALIDYCEWIKTRCGNSPFIIQLSVSRLTTAAFSWDLPLLCSSSVPDTAFLLPYIVCRFIDVIVDSFNPIISQWEVLHYGRCDVVCNSCSHNSLCPVTQGLLYLNIVSPKGKYTLLLRGLDGTHWMCHLLYCGAHPTIPLVAWLLSTCLWLPFWWRLMH